MSDKIHLAKSGSVLYDPEGPIISPRPGPTFDIAEADAEMEVKKSIPIKPSKQATIEKSAM